MRPEEGDTYVVKFNARTGMLDFVPLDSAGDAPHLYPASKKERSIRHAIMIGSRQYDRLVLSNDVDMPDNLR